MQTELEALGIRKELRTEVFNLIDRRDKLSAEDWRARGKEIGLDETQIMGIESLIANKELWKKSPGMQRFFKAIEVFGVQDYVKFAPFIIRGLDYYTGTVFEGWDTAGEFRAIFGGGRYDDLVNAVGGDPVPAVGFAIGNVVISLMLQAFGHLPDLRSAAPIYITAFDQERILDSLSLAAELRQTGLQITSDLSTDKLQKQFKQADRVGARLVLVLGPDEIQKNEVSVKDLRTGEQRSFPRNQLVHQLNLLLK
jgi:histidyl-tRNA synthetase